MTVAKRPTLPPVWVGVHCIQKIFMRDVTFTMMPIYTTGPFEPAGKQKQVKASSRKSKSPNLGQAYSGGERPSSVSSVHSEGDYHRQAQAQPQWSWDDRPSSTGEPSSCCCLSSVKSTADIPGFGWSPFLFFFLLSLSRIHAVPLQPADHAHNEQHATHLHCFPCHPEPAAAATAAAATSSWSPSGPAARVAVSAVGAIRDPV